MKIPVNLQRKPQASELALFFVIIFLAALFEYVGWFAGMQAATQKVLQPLLSLNTQIAQKFSEPYQHFVFTSNKSKYLEQLEVQHAQALAELNELDTLREENEELRKLLGASDRTLEQTTIIGAPIVSLAYPAVGVGSRDGVQLGDMVLVDQVLVGTIDQVTEYQSRVSLLSRKRKNRILARTESGVEGVIDGDGKNVLLTHIPRNAVLADGERVMTVGQEGIEKNVLIGTIRNVENNPSDATQTLVVNQLVSFYEAVVVEVK